MAKNLLGNAPAAAVLQTTFDGQATDKSKGETI